MRFIQILVIFWDALKSQSTLLEERPPFFSGERFQGYAGLLEMELQSSLYESGSALTLCVSINHCVILSADCIWPSAFAAISNLDSAMFFPACPFSGHLQGRF